MAQRDMGDGAGNDIQCPGNADCGMQSAEACQGAD
jgi:hypothetical protein